MLADSEQDIGGSMSTRDFVLKYSKVEFSDEEAAVEVNSVCFHGESI